MNRKTGRDPAVEDARERHARGAYYTRTDDILRTIEPALIRPFEERIARATTPHDVVAIHDRIASLRVLDPACGPGDFLVVTLEALRALEGKLRDHAHVLVGEPLPLRVSREQLYGIDVDPAAVASARQRLGLEGPLAHHIQHADALFCDWPRVDYIVGNPPFMSKNKLQEELGADYARRLRLRYPGAMGRADYCVYWFRRAHDELPSGGWGALVGTNTIRQNDSRRGGLEYIVERGGTIVEAIATRVWPGDAAVHVSVVVWVKGPFPGKKRLLTQLGDRPDASIASEEVDFIGPSLSSGGEASTAVALPQNRAASVCFQGITPGHRGFLLEPDEAAEILARAPESRDVLYPFLTGDDLLGRVGASPSRYVIDFGVRDLQAAQRYLELFERVERLVLPYRREAALRERLRNSGAPDRGRHSPRPNRHHQGFLSRYWQLAYGRADLTAKLESIPRYLACSRISRRPIFAFVDARVRPGDALTVFALPDDYSFGVLSSDLHGAWLRARGSTMKGDYRYTSTTVFDSFPWPMDPSPDVIVLVAEAAVRVREERVRANVPSLRALYSLVEESPGHPLRLAHAKLDQAVRRAYRMPEGAGRVAFLLDQNAKAACQARSGHGTGPGVPSGYRIPITDDCLGRDLGLLGG